MLKKITLKRKLQAGMTTSDRIRSAQIKVNQINEQSTSSISSTQNNFTRFVQISVNFLQLEIFEDEILDVATLNFASFIYFLPNTLIEALNKFWVFCLN